MDLQSIAVEKTEHPTETQQRNIKPFKLIFLRWFALMFWWTVGNLVWSNLPFFKQELGQSVINFLWNCNFCLFFLLPIWETLNFNFNKEDYLNSKSQSVTALLTLFKFFRGMTYEDKQSILFMAVRGFYLALMTKFLFNHIVNFRVPENFDNFLTYVLSIGFLQTLIFLCDVVPFVLAYFLNFGDFRTRSVDNTFSGWFFCLACYPPLNNIFGGWFGYNHDEYMGWWALPALALISVYSWSSLALGLRAGHLQYRGLCDTGPYSFVRHPAYAFKNMAWWVGVFAWSSVQIFMAADFAEGLTLVTDFLVNPLLIFNYSNSWVFIDLNNSYNSSALFSLVDTIKYLSWNMVAAAAWTFVYHMRALTEERHLSKYPEYREYCERVPHRYIPGVV
jgi:protein-S-isoprenylcysteine O-methyltransferase Ste14